MAEAFEDSKRALQQQLSPKLDIVHLVLLTFLAVLLFWAVAGELTLYRTSVSGTLKTEGGTIVVEPEVDGTIKSVDLHIGEKVEKGQRLLQLDDTRARLQLTKLENELLANKQQQNILHEQLKLTEQKFELRASTLANEIKQTQAELEQAIKVHATQQDIHNRMKQLANSSAVAKMDMLKQELEVVKADSSAKVHNIALDNKRRRLPSNQRESALALSQINAQLSALKDKQDQLEKSIGAAKLELNKYTIYAPGPGELVQISELPPGNKVSKGQMLATIIDGSQWALHTHFEAADAVGHIKPGQTARVLVDGFPWRQYGSLAAKVEHVAKEGSGSHVEVHLELADNPDSQIPLTYGQPVTVEIQTEKLTPLMLLLNAFDRMVRGKAE